MAYRLVPVEDDVELLRTLSSELAAAAKAAGVHKDEWASVARRADRMSQSYQILTALGEWQQLPFHTIAEMRQTLQSAMALAKECQTAGGLLRFKRSQCTLPPERVSEMATKLLSIDRYLRKRVSKGPDQQAQQASLHPVAVPRKNRSLPGSPERTAIASSVELTCLNGTSEFPPTPPSPPSPPLQSPPRAIRAPFAVLLELLSELDSHSDGNFTDAKRQEELLVTQLTCALLLRDHTRELCIRMVFSSCALDVRTAPEPNRPTVYEPASVVTRSRSASNMLDVPPADARGKNDDPFATTDIEVRMLELLQKVRAASSETASREAANNLAKAAKCKEAADVLARTTLPVLLRLWLQERQDQLTHDPAAMALIRLVRSRGTRNGKLVARQGLVPLLARVLAGQGQEQKPSPGCKRVAAQVLATMAVRGVAEDRAALATGSMVQVLLQVLGDAGEDSHTRKAIATILQHLLSYETAADALQQTPILSDLIRQGTAFAVGGSADGTSAAERLAGASALHLMHLVFPGADGSLPGLVGTLTDMLQGDDVSNRQAAAHVLGKIAAAHPTAQAVVASMPGAVARLLALLQYEAGPLRLTAAEALRALAANNAANQAVIVRANGIAAATELLDDRATDAVAAAARLLTALVGSPQIARSAMWQGPLRRLTVVAQQALAPPSLKQAAAEAIAQLALHSASPEPEAFALWNPAVPPCVQLLWERETRVNGHSVFGNPDPAASAAMVAAISAAAATLTILATANAELLNLIVWNDALPALVKRAQGANPTLARAALHALAAIARQPATAADLAPAGGQDARAVVPALVALLRTANERVRWAAAGEVRDIAVSHAVRLALTDAGAATLIGPLLARGSSQACVTAAAEALGNMAYQCSPAQEAIVAAGLVPQLVAWLDCAAAGPGAQEAAARCLSNLGKGNPTTVEAILSAGGLQQLAELAKSDQLGCREVAAQALANLSPVQ